MPDPKRVIPPELRGPARAAALDKRLRAVERYRGLPEEGRFYIGPVEKPTWVRPYLWMETGLGPDGEGFSFWIRTED